MDCEWWRLSGTQPYGLRRWILESDSDGRNGRRESEGRVVGSRREWMRLFGCGQILDS